MTFVFYLYKRFFPVFLSALFFFAMVLELVDILMNLWQFISENVSLKQILYIMLLYFPKSLSFALPLSVLFAAAYSLSDLYAKNELTVIFASGISLFRFTFPILIFSFIFSIASFFFEDRVVVPTFAKKVEKQEEYLNVRRSKSSDRLVILAENGNTIYKADFYDDTRKTLTNVYIVIRNEDKQLDSIIRAASATWRDDSWQLNDYTKYTYEENNITTSTSLDDFVFDEPPETFQRVVISIETISAGDAKNYIAYLRRAGLPISEPLSVYYKKYSFHAVLFIVVFLSIGLSGKTRKNVLLISLVLCVCAAVLFYISQMVTMLLAKFGHLTPLAGAWSPVVLFVFISIVFLRFART
ncbi:MAG: LptF/LptG family permease [Treponemataceae bacterium]